MSEESNGVQITITAEDEFSSSFDDLISQSSEASQSLGGLASTEGELSTSSDEGASSLSQFSTDANQLSSSTDQATTSISEANQAMEAGTTSFKQGAQGIASTAGVVGSLTASMYGLNDAYLQQQDADLRLTSAQNNLAKAHATVENATLSLQNAQTHLNLLVVEGITSGPQYTTAQNAVTKAQDSLNNANLALQNSQNNLTAAQNRARMASESVNQQWLMMGTSTIPLLLTQLPTIIAFTTGYGAADDALTASQMAQSAASGIATGATWLWNAALDANPIGIVVLAIAGLVAIIGIATDGFKNWTPVINVVKGAFNDLETAGRNVFGFLEEIFEVEMKGWMDVMNDFWDVIKPIVQGVEDLGSAIGSLFGGGSSSSSNSLNASSSATLQPVSSYNNNVSSSTSSSQQQININVQQRNQISSGYDASNAGNDLANQISQGLQTGY
jgi:hypothetical protein